MCGIAGVLNLDGNLDAEQMYRLAERMAARLAHRGPDDQGIWLSPDNNCALVHRRLSIIDPSAAGRQPMASDDGRYHLAFNGELYNFRELRDEFEQRGDPISSASDTAVFLKGLVREGLWFLTRADAMFALALYDSARGELFLGRDPFGEKPLYYTHQNGLFAFSSELAVLSELPGFDATVTTDAIASYLAFQIVPAPRTIYRSCRKLPPGCALRVGAEGVGEPVRYFDFIVDGRSGESGPVSGRDLDEQADALEETLLTALRRRLVSDVPLGAFLSGGVDSSTVVALAARRLGRSLQTFSIGYADTQDTEHDRAQAIARHLGVENHVKLLTPEAINLGMDLPVHMDEPIADSSCVPTYLISRWARQSVTVALTGDGADELFGGYVRYFHQMQEMAGRDADISARRWHIGWQYYSGSMLCNFDRDLPHLFGRIPAATSDLILSLRRRMDLDPRPLMHRFREMDAHHYLPVVLTKVDRMSMLNGLECRTPFLSVDVARFAAGLPEHHIHDGTSGKLVLKRLASRYLPAEWMNWPKRGFRVPVQDDWTRRHILPFVRRLLAEDDCRLALWTGRERLTRFLDTRFDHCALPQIWGLMVLETWMRHHPVTPLVDAA